MEYQLPKGLFDILPYGMDSKWKSTELWHYVEAVIRKLVRDYGYEEIRTPIFEQTSLFQRSSGEATDIIAKEMYTFEDRRGRSLSLRPEGTAPVMRAFIENNLNQWGSVHKFYYIGPMFRYERPQAGRYRQHYQFGIEAIGLNTPEQDVEIIDMLCEFFHRLGISDLTLYINSLGDSTSKENYKKHFIEYLKPIYEKLSEDSQRRFKQNPLRILDSKDPTDRKLMEKAPSILDYLSKPAQEHFNAVCKLLDHLKRPYTIDHKLVRGLDYYSKTVFEVVTGGIGAQNSLAGGGRYDNLLLHLGGPDLPGVGFGSGIERILQVILAQKIPTPSLPSCFFYFIPLGDKEKELCFILATTLRHSKIPCTIELKPKQLQKSLQQASKQQARYAVIMGSNELANQNLQIKDLEKKQQREIPITNFCQQAKVLWQEYENQKFFRESYV